MSPIGMGRNWGFGTSMVELLSVFPNVLLVKLFCFNLLRPIKLIIFMKWTLITCITNTDHASVTCANIVVDIMYCFTS